MHGRVKICTAVNLFQNIGDNLNLLSNVKEGHTGTKQSTFARFARLLPHTYMCPWELQHCNTPPKAWQYGNIASVGQYCHFHSPHSTSSSAEKKLPFKSQRTSGNVIVSLMVLIHIHYDYHCMLFHFFPHHLTTFTFIQLLDWVLTSS